jgi:hypothetical protein
VWLKLKKNLPRYSVFSCLNKRKKISPFFVKKKGTFTLSFFSLLRCRTAAISSLSFLLFVACSARVSSGNFAYHGIVVIIIITTMPWISKISGIHPSITLFFFASCGFFFFFFLIFYLLLLQIISSFFFFVGPT